MKRAITLCLILLAMAFADKTLHGQNPPQAALIEKAYQDSSVTLLYEFFDNWSAEISSNEDNAPNQWVAEAHKVFKAFYQPLQLDKIGCGEFESRFSYKDLPYFIVQNTLYRISVTDTLPFKPDELEAFYTNRINQTYSDDSIRKKWIEYLQREISYGRMFLVLDDKDIWPTWQKMAISAVDSSIEFRPQVSFPDKKIVYLTYEYEQLLNKFLGNTHVELGENGIMQPAYSKDESRQREQFLMKAAKIFYGHWGGYWQYETYPEATSIIFDTRMQRAVVNFRFIYEGGVVYMEKKDGEWTVVSGELTWIE